MLIRCCKIYWSVIFFCFLLSFFFFFAKFVLHSSTDIYYDFEFRYRLVRVSYYVSYIIYVSLPKEIQRSTEPTIIHLDTLHTYGRYSRLLYAQFPQIIVFVQRNIRAIRQYVIVIASFSPTPLLFFILFRSVQHRFTYAIRFHINSNRYIRTHKTIVHNTSKANFFFIVSNDNYKSVVAYDVSTPRRCLCIQAILYVNTKTDVIFSRYDMT